MVFRALRKLIKGNLRGFLMTKYFGIPVMMLIIAYFVAYSQLPKFRAWVDKNIRSKLPRPFGTKGAS